MFAIAFDLDVHDTERAHSGGVTRAYLDIRNTLAKFDFEWSQGSVYVTTNEDLANLTIAMNALRELPWFPAAVRDIRAFRVEQWSDFTRFMKSKASLR